MSKKKSATPVIPPEPPSDYERGVLAVLMVLGEEVARMSDAHREAIRLMWNASAETQSLLNFANPAVNIVGDVQNRVERRMRAHIIDRRQKAGVLP